MRDSISSQTGSKDSSPRENRPHNVVQRDEDNSIFNIRSISSSRHPSRLSDDCVLLELKRHSHQRGKPLLGTLYAVGGGSRSTRGDVSLNRRVRQMAFGASEAPDSSQASDFVFATLLPSPHQLIQIFLQQKSTSKLTRPKKLISKGNKMSQC